MDGENNGCNPIKIDDLGVALFLETPISWKKYMKMSNQIFVRLFQGFLEIAEIPFVARGRLSSVVYCCCCKDPWDRYIYLHEWLKKQVS